MHGLQEGHRDYNSPVISTRTKALHGNVWCFFVAAKRVRASFTRESAVHGLQESHRDYNSPVISTRTKKRLSQPSGRDKRFLFYCAPKRILKS